MPSIHPSSTPPLTQESLPITKDGHESAPHGFEKEDDDGKKTHHTFQRRANFEMKK
jgi:hypothetical protein